MFLYFCRSSWEIPLQEETHKWSEVKHVSVANGAIPLRKTTTKMFAEQGWLI